MPIPARSRCLPLSITTSLSRFWLLAALSALAGCDQHSGELVQSLTVSPDHGAIHLSGRHLWVYEDEGYTTYLRGEDGRWTQGQRLLTNECRCDLDGDYAARTCRADGEPGFTIYRFTDGVGWEATAEVAIDHRIGSIAVGPDRLAVTETPPGEGGPYMRIYGDVGAGWTLLDDRQFESPGYDHQESGSRPDFSGDSFSFVQRWEYHGGDAGSILRRLTLVGGELEWAVTHDLTYRSDLHVHMDGDRVAYHEAFDPDYAGPDYPFFVHAPTLDPEDEVVIPGDWPSIEVGGVATLSEDAVAALWRRDNRSPWNVSSYERDHGWAETRIDSEVGDLLLASEGQLVILSEDETRLDIYRF